VRLESTTYRTRYLDIYSAFKYILARLLILYTTVLLVDSATKIWAHCGTILGIWYSFNVRRRMGLYFVYTYPCPNYRNDLFEQYIYLTPACLVGD
jgi:hypothetical protein